MLVAQLVNHWPTDLAVLGLSPAQGEIFSTLNRVSIVHSLSLASTHSLQGQVIYLLNEPILWPTSPRTIACVIVLTFANEHQHMGIYMFLHHLRRGTTFVTSCLLLWAVKSFLNGSTLKEKTIALRGTNSTSAELTPLRREAKMKLTELLPLNMYPFHFIRLWMMVG